MAIYLGVTVLSVLAAMLVYRRPNVEEGFHIKRELSRQDAVNMGGAVLVFLLLFAVSACRIAVGNDYWVYRSYMLLIAQNREVATEFGFNLVVKICQFLTGNPECYLLVLGLFSFGTVYFFIKAVYDQSQWFSFSVYLLLTGSYYFLSLNSVRYYFALAIALFAMKYVIRREYLRFVLLTLIGACFHKSILVILLLYPLAGICWKKWTYILFGAGCVSFLLFEDFYRRIIFLFYPYYENSMFDDGSVSYTNILKSAAIVVLCILYYNKSIKGNESNRFYFQLQIGALALYCFGSFIPEISRIGYYLNSSLIFLIPGVIVGITNKKQRIFWSVAVGVAFFLFFLIFLKGSYDISIRILPYRNWIFN